MGGGGAAGVKAYSRSNLCQLAIIIYYAINTLYITYTSPGRRQLLELVRWGSVGVSLRGVSLFVLSYLCFFYPKIRGLKPPPQAPPCLRH